MSRNNKGITNLYGHRIFNYLILCLFGLSVSLSVSAQKDKQKQGTKVYIDHADILRYNQMEMPNVQIAKLFCLVITRINSTFVIGNDLPGKTGFCFQRFGVVSGSETEIPGAENRIAHDSFCGQPLVAARWKSHKNRGGLWSMPFSQIRYILLAHRSSEKTDTGQRIDTPLNPLPTSKDLQKSFTVGFGKTGAPAYGRRRKGIGPANKIDRRRAPPERCNYDFGTFGGT